jgi:DNA-binding CsgD family transcriptional regulator
VFAGCHAAAKEFLAHPSLAEPGQITPWPMPWPSPPLLHALLALGDNDLVGAELHAFTVVERAAGQLWAHQALESFEVLACTGGPERTARLAAAAQRIREAHGSRLRAEIIEKRLPVALAEARSSLGPEFDTLWAEGAMLTLDEVFAHALRMRGERKRPDYGWASLTPTEAEVVDLVAQGLTNPQIAAKLLIETSTVKTHLHHVFTKLGVTSRAQLAAEAVRRREPA